MKKLTTFLLSICFLFLFSSVTSAYTNDGAQDLKIEGPSAIDDVTIKLSGFSRYDALLKTRWFDFKFVNQGDGTAKLKFYQNGKIYEHYEIDDHQFVLYNTVTIKFYNEKNEIFFEKHLPDRPSLRDFAYEVSKVSMRYGLDSIQILPGNNSKRQLAITGPVLNNFINEHFDRYIPRHIAEIYKFNPKTDGLYAEIIGKSTIAEGQYIIESIDRPNFFLFAEDLDSANVMIKSRIQTEPQKWNVVFNEKYDAYEIHSERANNVLTWASSKGNNVINYTKANDVLDQLWYFKDLGNGEYNIFNAYNPHKYLNLDVNKENISVSNKTGLTQQKFKLTKVN